MNYQSTELQHQLAARFVVGSMRGLARRRFQRLMMDIPKLRDEVAFWEEHLHELTNTIPIQQPSERVWQRIQSRLGWIQSKTETTSKWPWFFGAFASLLLIVNLVMLIPADPIIAPTIERVAVIQSSEARTLWLIEQREQRLEVAAVGAIERLPNEDYQLWMLPVDGTPPISLGLLPQQGDAILDLGTRIDLAQVAALAVSREPLGGSPEPVPTGPVLYTTDLIRM